MANYELYLIFLLCSGVIVLSALACIWVMLSAGKPGREDRTSPTTQRQGKPARGVPPTKLELKGEETTSALEVEELVDTTLHWKPEASLEGSRGAILQAYYKAMKIVEGMTEILMKPQSTLRGFLEEATPQLNGAAEAFTGLTSLAERVLYSPYMPGEDEVLKAESLALKVEEIKQCI